MIANIIMATILAIFFICQIYAFRTGVPTVATLPGRRRKMVAILIQEFERRGRPESYKIVDLGSGGGQLCAAIARALPQVVVTGVEFSPLPHWRAMISKQFLGPKNVSFLRGDFWNYDVSNADAIVLFLNKKVMTKMGGKLHRELKPGCLIVSNDERVGDGWEPIETISDPILGLESRIYLYRQS